MSFKVLVIWKQNAINYMIKYVVVFSLSNENEALVSVLKTADHFFKTVDVFLMTNCNSGRAVFHLNVHHYFQ